MEEQQSNPALEEAKAEHTRALTDESHPQHKLWEKDPDAWERWGTELFKKAGVTGQVDGSIVTSDEGGKDLPLADEAEKGLVEANDRALAAIREEHKGSFPEAQANFRAFMVGVDPDLLPHIDNIVPPRALPDLFRAASLLGRMGYIIVKQ